jgi:transcription antitermination factor NusG
MEQWFALYVQPRKEKLVEKELTKHSFINYLPLKREVHKWSDRKKTVMCPLIPSYIFVKVKKEELYNVLQIVGAVRFIYFGKEPAPIPDKQIQDIKTFLENKVNITLEPMSFEKGDKVRIVDGRFKGAEGLIIVGKDNKKRFKIRISNLLMDLDVEFDEKEMENMQKIEE